MQMPEQVVIERGAHPHQPRAVIDQQPDVELDPGQRGDRQPVNALAQRGSPNGDGIDQVGLAAITPAAPLARHQPRRHPNDAFAVDEQEPLKGARDMPAVSSAQTRSAPSRRAQSRTAANPLWPTLTLSSPISS